ncbi:hypothetical protein [Streptomyces sp. ISL-100]|uniref:hypothetical protein n=1 Tax=Streptomyces sp. ISL-100 TaxID=2819173 RepID=UPI001BEBD14C|nr:hypothetical protein [Streptomyces sp. ISL-100]MBT2398325.1 hypothetical protein [Streptomyces sp. ISL-100]
MAAASDGRASAARSAVRSMLRYGGGEGPCGEERVDGMLVDLLLDAARPRGTESTRAAMERRVDLLSATVGVAGPDRGHVKEQRDAAVRELAEHLQATASPSDVIELFLRDLMRTGVSARYDQTVQAAYLHRAAAREEAGDIGGAQRDRVCAERIGAGLPDQGLLFGPARGRRRHHDSGQGALF